MSPYRFKPGELPPAGNTGWMKPEDHKWMTKEEVAALLWGAEQIRGEYPWAADCFWLMYLLGLRAGEVRLLRYEHLEAQFIDAGGSPRAVQVPSLKKKIEKRKLGRNPLHWVPVLAHWSRVKAAFDPRHRAGKEQAAGWLFPSPRTIDKPITVRAIQYAWNAARKASGLPSWYTTHSLRHSAARAIYAKHREQSLLSRFLRHTMDVFGNGASSTPTYMHMTVRDWEPFIKSKCMVLPDLKRWVPGRMR